MTDRVLERKLANALTHTAPNDPQGVLSRCEPRKGNVIPMTKKTTKGLRTSLIAACLALVLAGGSAGAFYQQSYAVASVVSLDVNPSIELTVNKKERVLSCKGLNAEAAAVLSDMGGGADLKDTKLDVAVNAIVGALVRNGYLGDISSAILISVEDKDQDRASKLRQELTSAVDTILQGSASNAAVLSQTVARDAALETQAKENNISTGKAALVNLVLKHNSALTADDATRERLSALSVEELRDMSERTDVPSLPVDKRSVAQAVLEYAGLAQMAPVGWTVDPELDEAVPHYEVEIHYNSREYEYVVDAFTGEILSGRKDIVSTVSPTPNTPTTSTIGESKAFELALADLVARFPELSGKESLGQTIELDRDNGRLHYDVEFYIDGFEADYEIDADTGAVLSWDTEYEGPIPTPNVPAASTNTDIGKEAAIAAALKHAGLTRDQVSRLKAERDTDDGRPEYEIEFKSGGMEYEYTIDARTGSVLEHEKEWD